MSAACDAEEDISEFRAVERMVCCPCYVRGTRDGRKRQREKEESEVSKHESSLEEAFHSPSDCGEVLQLDDNDVRLNAVRTFFFSDAAMK